MNAECCRGGSLRGVCKAEGHLLNGRGQEHGGGVRDIWEEWKKCRRPVGPRSESPLRQRSCMCGTPVCAVVLWHSLAVGEQL